MTSTGPLEPEIARAKDPVVCLVHGTIPSRFSKIPWLQESSWFRKNLFPLGEDRVHYSPFYWSGTNSHKGRIEAGTDLAAHLAELRNRYPAAQHICVAHGHGGNVAAYACRRLRQSAAPLPDRLITLGTPFVWTTKRDLGAVREQLLSISGCGAALGMFVYLLLKSGVVGAPQYAGEVAITIIACGWAVFLLTFFHLRPDRLGRIAEKQYAALATELDLELRTLCICACRGEAETHVKFLEMATRALSGEWKRKLWQMMIEVLAVINIFQVHLFFRHLVGSPLLVRKKLDPGSACIVAFLIVVMGLVAIASAMGFVALLIMIIAGAWLPSGPWSLYENLLFPWVLKIKIRETPMTANAQAAKQGIPVTKEEWIYSSYSFEHSHMCGDARVCESIREWLCRSERFSFLRSLCLADGDRIFAGLDHSRIEAGAVNSTSP